MTDSLPLCVFLSWYGFALLAVCLGSLAFSRWFCNVDPNLTLLFYLYDFIYFDKSLHWPESSTNHDEAFTLFHRQI